MGENDVDINERVGVGCTGNQMAGLAPVSLKELVFHEIALNLSKRYVARNIIVLHEADLLLKL